MKYFSFQIIELIELNVCGRAIRCYPVKLLRPESKAASRWKIHDSPHLFHIIIHTLVHRHDGLNAGTAG